MEEEAEAGGETAVDQMEVAGDMEVTGDVVVSGCDDKNWWFWPLFFSFQILCYNFFFLDFSLKFVWHKNFEGVPDIAWGCSYFFLRINK